MKIHRMLMAASAALMIGGARTALAGQGPVKVEVSIPASHTVWYTDPLWLAIGGAAVLLVVVLAFMASRKKTTTTVIR